ncbi:hypothetical protein VPH35_117825 [Triticum aestivum]
MPLTTRSIHAKASLAHVPPAPTHPSSPALLHLHETTILWSFDTSPRCKAGDALADLLSRYRLTCLGSSYVRAHHGHTPHELTKLRSAPALHCSIVRWTHLDATGMADTSTFAAPPPPWMPSPAMFFTPPALPGYYQGSAAGAVPGEPREGGGSIGTFFGVLAAVLVLTAVSCVFGRVCRAQAEGADEVYDCARLSRRWRWWSAPPRIVRRGAKPPPVEEVPAALPLPEP